MSMPTLHNPEGKQTFTFDWASGWMDGWKHFHFFALTSRWDCLKVHEIMGCKWEAIPWSSWNENMVQKGKAWSSLIMKLLKSCFGMDYEMETPIQALVIQINMVWNQFHEIIHELIRYAHALGWMCARPWSCRRSKLWPIFHKDYWYLWGGNIPLMGKHCKKTVFLKWKCIFWIILSLPENYLVLIQMKNKNA